MLIEDCDIAGLTSAGARALEVEVRRSRIYGDFRINPRTSVAIDNATSFSNFSLNAQHGGYYELSASAGQRRGGECGDLRSGSRRHRYQRA